MVLTIEIFHTQFIPHLFLERGRDPGLAANEARKLRPIDLLQLGDDLDSATSRSNDSYSFFLKIETASYQLITRSVTIGRHGFN